MEKDREKYKETDKRNKRRTGAKYEQAAGDYLQQLGYEIVEYNYRCRFGEIDIIAKDGIYLVFCEVKYRSGPQKGSSLDAVDARKQRKIFRCAAHYLAGLKNADVPCRFDVIGIDGTAVTHIKNAFSG